LFHENVIFYLETLAIIGFHCVRNNVSFYHFLVQAQKWGEKKDKRVILVNCNPF
jgi:hypothetical protein